MTMMKNTNNHINLGFALFLKSTLHDDFNFMTRMLLEEVYYKMSSPFVLVSGVDRHVIFYHIILM